MRRSVDPRQGRLFDPFDGIIPPLGRKQIDEGWQGVFRSSLLHLMPVRQLGKHFDPAIGRPTKELYSVAGLLLLQEMNDWTNAQATEAYVFRTDVQYALNLEPGQDEMCERTLERYRALFIEDELAQQVMHSVTATLVNELELKIDRQRLDSTHVFSNMACFGRTRLMAITIKRFLTQVKRHHLTDYEALPEPLRQRYALSQGRLFVGKGQSAEERVRNRQQVAEDLHELIGRFADHPCLRERPTYRALVTVFEQQCEIVEANVRVRAKTGGACLQNPSDPEATYDGNKGAGYKVQLSETCSDDNDVQMIVGAVAQTASSPDVDALDDVLDDLKKNDCLPETMVADTSFGSDENVQKAANEGVDLISPTAGGVPAAPATEPLTIDDFAVDERTGQVKACPAGRIPLQTIQDRQAGTTTIEMNPPDCISCAFRPACPIRKKHNSYQLTYTDRELRLAARRQEEKTDVFREAYAKRSGIESTNSGLKRRLGLGKLRVRGWKSVSHAIYLKVAGWNLLRAAASGRLRRFAQAQSWPAQWFWRLWTAYLTWKQTILRFSLLNAGPCTPVPQLN
jgi:hypothetical protein